MSAIDVNALLTDIFGTFSVVGGSAGVWAFVKSVARDAAKAAPQVAADVAEVADAFTKALPVPKAAPPAPVPAYVARIASVTAPVAPAEATVPTAPPVPPAAPVAPVPAPSVTDTQRLAAIVQAAQRALTPQK